MSGDFGGLGVGGQGGGATSVRVGNPLNQSRGDVNDKESGPLQGMQAWGNSLCGRNRGTEAEKWTRLKRLAYRRREELRE